jgi:phospholipid-binding lipoprotein MlaA
MNRHAENSLNRSARGMRRMVGCVLMLAGFVLTGCATGPNANPRDPMEPFNRGVFGFNEALDKAVIKPVATVYKAVTPEPVRGGVGHFFANLEDAWSAFNSVLQFKPQSALENFMRFMVNSTLGLAGVIDVASDMRLERHPEDFGQTLGHWGMGAGPFVMLPVLGPSSLRDTIAIPVDFKGDIVANVEHVASRNSLKVLNIIDLRSSYLNASSVIEDAALDKYSFTRDAFLQRRQYSVFDGNPPDEELKETAPPR